MREARRCGSGSIIAAKTDCSAEGGETDTEPVRAATRGVVSNNARPSEYIHIYGNYNYMSMSIESTGCRPSDDCFKACGLYLLPFK